MSHGYRIHEIEDMPDEDIIRVYKAYRRREADEEVRSKILARWIAWICVHPYFKEGQIPAQEEFWKWEHDLPTREELAKIIAKEKADAEKWKSNALAYMKRTGLIHSDGQDTSESIS